MEYLLLFIIKLIGYLNKTTLIVKTLVFSNENCQTSLILISTVQNMLKYIL